MSHETNSSIPRLRVGEIQITNPAIGATVALSNDCTISVSGTFDPLVIRQIMLITSDHGGSFSGGTGGTWALNNAGPFYAGVLNKICLTFTYVELTSGSTMTSDPMCREFMATGGGSSCYSSMLAAPGSLMPSRVGGDVIRQALPRYYRVELLSSIAQSSSGFEHLAGGLLVRSGVYLGYDVASSNPREAVYRSLNLPEAIGQWTLRLQQYGNRFSVELAHYKLGEGNISPPTLFVSENWKINSENLLRPDCVPCSGSAPNLLSATTLLVAPA